LLIFFLLCKEAPLCFVSTMHLFKTLSWAFRDLLTAGPSPILNF
jgi:hypothetical protein